MKKTNLLNSEISFAIAKMGHTDQLTICDCGLPIAESNHRIDLAVTEGIPPFLDVLDTVLTELEVQKIYLAREIEKESPDLMKAVIKRFPETPVVFIDHEDLKERVKFSKAVIRTGECTSYANIILESGVVF